MMAARIGLEIHQQLDTGSKLFCRCAPAASWNYDEEFGRRLRVARGETGRADRAAIFEVIKDMAFTYHAAPGICMVERDEAPPLRIDPGSWRAALVVSGILGSRVFGGVYPMRKIVIDGSNTSGFQRTMLVSRGGSFNAGGASIGIQTVCLEEDAAEQVGTGGSFGLGRLGVPLIEIATEPFDPGAVRARDAALALGRMLRSTGAARRGIGSIRQDVNVSVDGGSVVEVKGVQQLDLLDKVAKYEEARQRGMARISGMLSGWSHDPSDISDVGKDLEGTRSEVLARGIARGDAVLGARFSGLAGAFGYEPPGGMRLGRDVAEVARALGLGGVFHSDELPAYGITEGEVGRVAARLGAGEGDAFLLISGPGGRLRGVMSEIISRMGRIRDHGVQADTRAAQPDGSTRFLRPRPGAARMYPETDVPPVFVTGAELEEAARAAPEPWEARLASLEKSYGLNAQLAEQVLDSRYAALFPEVAGRDPTFVASSLCSTITSLERDGGDAGLLDDAEIAAAFGMLWGGKIAKESVEIIFREVMAGRARTAAEAVSSASLGAMGGAELEAVVDKLVRDNIGLVRRQGERAAGPLMGMAMKELRGRVAGEELSRLLLERIKKA